MLQARRVLSTCLDCLSAWGYLSGVIKIVFLFFILVLGVPNSKAIVFDRSLPLAYQRIIENDLENLCRQIDYNLETEEARAARETITRFFEIEEVDCVQLRDWLEERIKLIVYFTTLEELNARIIFQRGNKLKELSLLDRIGKKFSGFMNNLEIKYVLNFRGQAANLGKTLYNTSQLPEERARYVDPFQDSDNYFRYMGANGEEGLLPLTTPRVGIILVMENFFSYRTFPDPTTAYSVANGILRISILVHEARHSDGRGDNATFSHVSCSDGSEQSTLKFLVGRNCDNALNGSYGLQAAFLDYAILACHSCNAGEKSRLSWYLDKMKEKIIKGSGFVDARPIE